MKLSRREFIKLSAIASVGFAVTGKWAFDAPKASAFYNSQGLQKFIQPLRGVYPLDPNGIPVAVPDKTVFWDGGKMGTKGVPVSHYTIDVNQFQDQLHPNLGPTTLRGYHSRANLGGTPPQRHLGGIIIAEKGKAVQLTVQNNLTGNHPLPVDPMVMAGIPVTPNRVSTHLHGGLVPWISDGGPETWFGNTTDGTYGPSAQSGTLNVFKKLNPALKAGQGEYYYPNNQSARFMWYHDHAMDITRLNAYAGMATGYIIRDLFESGLRNLGLPDFVEKGGNEIPLIIQDKIFVGADVMTKDPTWTGLTTPGSLWYPHTYDETIWPRNPAAPMPMDPSVVPESFGDTMLVNGTVFPYAPVQPRRYRLRILNACQGRFLNLQLYEDNGNGQPNKATRGPDFLVIGTEGGFLNKPVLVPSNQPIKYLADGVSVDPLNPGGSLITAPAERWDVIVDFSGFAGKKFILYNDAPAPFPAGDPMNDYQSGLAGPDTRTIMRFDVAGGITGTPDKPMKITTATPLAANPISMTEELIVPWGVSVVNGAVQLPPGVPVRQLTLNEVYDEHGRLAQMLGTNVPVALPAGFSEDIATPDYPNNYARQYASPVTESVREGKVEVWQIANLTGDTHPMHFHLVNCQVLARQSFVDAAGVYHYANGVPTYQGPARAPSLLERGWKETVHMHPGDVTTVIMRFDLAKVPFDVPMSPRTGGHEFVWHCHILDHEEHDMMRPLVVK